MKKIFNFLSVVILQLISLTYIHELGHAIFGYLNNCNTKSIIFDNGFTAYTITYCNKFSILIVLGGLVLTLIFSVIFLIFGKEFFLLSISLSFLLSLEDLAFFINQLYIIVLSSFLSFLAYFELFRKLERK